MISGRMLREYYVYYIPFSPSPRFGWSNSQPPSLASAGFVSASTVGGFEPSLKMWSKLQAYAYIRITDPNRPFLEVRETIEVYWARGPIVCLHRYIPPFFPYLGYYCTYSTVRTNALSRSARKHRPLLASLSFFFVWKPKS